MNRSVSVVLARDTAVLAHGDQRYGEHPFVKHLDDVHDILLEYAPGRVPEYVLAAAYLHDVLEDTKMTSFEIERHFGRGVLDIVKFCTDSPGKTRKERKAATYSRWQFLRSKDEPHGYDNHRAVKIADRIANVRCSAGTRRLAMYRREQPDFEKAIGPHPLLDPLRAAFYYAERAT